MDDTVVDASADAAPRGEWARLICFRTIVLRPKSIDELKDRLQDTHLDKRRVRAPGTPRSCSEIVASDVIVDTSELPKGLIVEAKDKPKVADVTIVGASANMTLNEFLAQLSAHGKSITSTGVADHQTLAGLSSTATAPSGSRHAMYEGLEGVDLVTVDAAGCAVERRISRGDTDFTAVVCSLALLDVLTRVCFRVVDERFFSVVMQRVCLKDVLTKLDATTKKYDFWRVNWLPESDQALLWAATAIRGQLSNLANGRTSLSSKFKPRLLHAVGEAPRPPDRC